MVRDDDQTWHRAHSFPNVNPEILFTHGMCPMCFATKWAELEED